MFWPTHLSAARVPTMALHLSKAAAHLYALTRAADSSALCRRSLSCPIVSPVSFCRWRRWDAEATTASAERGCKGKKGC